MKKKVLSIFLALMLCLSLLPTAALAEEAGTAGAGDTFAAEQGEGNTVTEQDENSTVTGQDGDNSVTGQGEGDVLSKQSVSAAAFSSAAGTHSHENGAVFAQKLSQNEDGTLQIDGETWGKDESGYSYVLPAGEYYLESNLTLNASITVNETVTLCLNGKSIEFTGNHTCILVHGTFTLTDCKGTGTITHREKDDGSKYPGNGVYVYGDAFNMEGGSITGNTTTSNGGGVYVFQGTFNMSGGSITGNTATGDGKTTGTGGGVFVGDGKFNISGGSITDNTAVNGGGVWVHSGEFKVSGGVKISGNKKSDGSNSNVYLPSGKTISVTGKLGGAEIGVTTATKPGESAPVEIAKGSDYGMKDSDAAVFFADDLVNYRTKLDGDVVQLSTGETQMVHPVCGKVCTHKNEDGSLKHPDNKTWKPWSDATKLPYDGYYYLTVDVTLTETWSLSSKSTVALDLNGKTVSIKTSSNTIESRGNVTLTDCRGGGKITHSAGLSGRGVSVNGGTFDMYGGSITGNTSQMGGGVYVGGGGTFNLYGGSISGNNATGSQENGRGGGVYVYGGTFNMYGGSISGNRASTYGGGVYVKDGTFNMYGGSITDNRATGSYGGYGGGVGMKGGTFNMKAAASTKTRLPITAACMWAAASMQVKAAHST